MKSPVFEGEDLGVTRDLAKKAIIDVCDALGRIIDIAPPPQATILTAGGGAAIGLLATLLDNQAGVESKSGKPQNTTILLSALIMARYVIDNKKDYVREAMRDIDTLTKSGRFKP